MELLQNIPNNLIIEPEQPVSKKVLRLAMGYSERTFTKNLSILESEIKEIDHRYKKTCSLLNPRVARFIVDALGFDILEIRRTIKYLEKPKK